jgi:hypothetical protein
LWALVVVVVVVAGVWIAGALRWQEHQRELQSGLMQFRREPAPAVFVEHELDLLPANVQRFFHTVLPPGQRVVAAARLRHRGTMNLASEGESWVPFVSHQSVVTQRPAFVWNATVTMWGVVPVRVVDAYVRGEGRSEAALCGLVPLGEQRGRGAVATAQLQRFLAEAPWYPTALLPRQGVQWRAAGDRQATATLQDGDASATLTFTFDAEGRIERVHADARGRRVGDELVPTPWTGRFWDYAERDGMQVPLQAEVAWVLPDGERPYWRGRIDTIDYEWAR